MLNLVERKEIARLSKVKVEELSTCHERDLQEIASRRTGKAEISRDILAYQQK